MLKTKSVLITKIFLFILILSSWFFTALFASSSYTLEAHVNHPFDCLFLRDDNICLQKHQQETETIEVTCELNSPTSTFNDFYKINSETLTKLLPLKCTNITNNLSSPVSSTKPNSVVDTDKKGQFGDTFGALTSFFTILAFLFVAAGYSQQKSILESTKTEYENNTNTRLLTEYWNLVEKATNTYRNAIESITYVDEKKNCTLDGRNALLSIWRTHMCNVDPNTKANTKFAASKRTYSLGAQAYTIYEPFLSNGQVPSSCRDSITHEKWHTFPSDIIKDPKNIENMSRLFTQVTKEWQILYEANRYYLDTIFNSLSYLYHVIDKKAPNKGQEQIKKDASTQFLSGLNAIEITFMLAKLNDGTENKWAELLKKTEGSNLFSTYEPGIDPIAILYLWKWKLPKE